MTKVLVTALYKFVTIADREAVQVPLQAACDAAGVKGTLLIAHEGINGTIAGPEDGILAVLEFLGADPRFADIVHKGSWAGEMPFLRMKVRLKNEIVTMGVPDTDPRQIVGTYVKPAEWNALISDPDVLVVDTRNDYEVEIGTFKGAIDPKTLTFRDFPQWVESASELKTAKKVAMFCTGGIRCEKSTAYLKSQGFEDVYHLEGGILKYLEEVPAEDSLWQGECFVFDGRISVGHGLVPGDYDQCHGCRRPITEADKQSADYMLGVCCPKCVADLTPEKRERFTERQKQMELAAERHEVHLGADYSG